MHIAQGKYFIDGADVWTAFGIVFSEGFINALLEQPKRKASLTHDWQDANGLDIDTTRVYFEKRDVTGKIGIIASDAIDFTNKFTSFFALLAQPGKRRVSDRLLKKDYYMIYTACGKIDTNGIFTTPGEKIITFDITFTEPEPLINTDLSFIVDGEGGFLIT